MGKSTDLDSILGNNQEYQTLKRQYVTLENAKMALSQIVVLLDEVSGLIGYLNDSALSMREIINRNTVPGVNDFFDDTSYQYLSLLTQEQRDGTAAALKQTVREYRQALVQDGARINNKQSAISNRIHALRNQYTE